MSSILYVSKKAMAVLCIVLAVYFSTHQTVHAQSPVVVIAPALSDVRLDNGDVDSVDIVLRNPGDAPLNMSASIEDFTPGEGGAPVYEPNLEFSLVDFIEDIDPFTLLPGEQKLIPVTISVPEDAAPQEYYGSVTFKTDLENDVAVASLLFVAVGNPQLEGEVAGITTTAIDADEATIRSASIALTINNTGKYRFTPNADLRIIDELGKPVATLLPENPGSVLPESSRTYLYGYTGALDATKAYTLKLANPKLGSRTVLDGEVEDIAFDTVVQEAPNQEPEQTDETAAQNSDTPSNVNPSSDTDDSSATILFAGLGGALFVILAGMLFVIRRTQKRSTYANTYTAQQYSATQLPTQPQPQQTHTPTQPPADTGPKNPAQQ